MDTTTNHYVPLQIEQWCKEVWYVGTWKNHQGGFKKIEQQGIK